jgi:transcription elongation factor SPT6
MYAFCINREYPGYFNLCFKQGQGSKMGVWPVKVIPNQFEIMGQKYPTMHSLKNGFKTIFAKQQERLRAQAAARR